MSSQSLPMQLSGHARHGQPAVVHLLSNAEQAPYSARPAQTQPQHLEPPTGTKSLQAEIKTPSGTIHSRSRPATVSELWRAQSSLHRSCSTPPARGTNRASPSPPSSAKSSSTWHPHPSRRFTGQRFEGLARCLPSERARTVRTQRVRGSMGAHELHENLMHRAIKMRVHSPITDSSSRLRPGLWSSPIHRKRSTTLAHSRGVPRIHPRQPRVESPRRPSGQFLEVDPSDLTAYISTKPFRSGAVGSPTFWGRSDNQTLASRQLDDEDGVGAFWRWKSNLRESTGSDPVERLGRRRKSFAFS